MLKFNFHIIFLFIFLIIFSCVKSPNIQNIYGIWEDEFNGTELLESIPFLEEIIKMKVKHLSPMLLNRYNRKYYQSINKQYRITIDTGQVFYYIGNQNNSFLNKSIDDINIILELKYDQKFDNNANRVTNHFPFHITKSSKYVSGINKIFHVPF